MKCTGHRTNGDPCQSYAINGTDRCTKHSGRKKADHIARGQVVMALRRWGVDDIPEEPGLLALKLMTITSWRQQEYEDEINRILTETGLTRSEALVGDAMVIDRDGSPHKVGEYIRSIVVMERDERELAANLAFKVLAANVNERLTRVQEQTGALFVDLVQRIMGDPRMEINDQQRTVLPAVASEHLRALTGGAA